MLTWTGRAPLNAAPRTLGLDSAAALVVGEIIGVGIFLTPAEMTKALGSPYDVTGAGFLPGIGTMIRVEGLAASVSYRAERLAGLLPGGEIVEGGEHWASLRDVRPFWGQSGDVWQVICRPSDAMGLVARAEARAHLLDWGGGLIWFLTEPDHELRQSLGAFQGHTRRIRGGPDNPPLSPEVEALNLGLYRQFDPKGLFARHSHTKVQPWTPSTLPPPA